LGVIGFGAFSCGPVEVSDKPSGTSESSPYALTFGTWVDCEINTDGNEIWFSFAAVSGNTYSIYIEDYDEDQSLVDVDVSAKYQGDSSFSLAWMEDPSGIDDPVVFTTNATKTVLVRVEQTLSGLLLGTGDFSIKVTETAAAPLGSEENPYPLDSYTWSDEDYDCYFDNRSSPAIWFAIEVEDGEQYSIWWDDDYQDGSGSCDADIRVSAKYQGASGWISGATLPTGLTGAINNLDSCYTKNPVTVNTTFTATEDGIVLIQVKPETIATYGRYPDDTGTLNSTKGATTPTPGTTQEGNFAIAYTIGAPAVNNIPSILFAK